MNCLSIILEHAYADVTTRRNPIGELHDVKRGFGLCPGEVKVRRLSEQIELVMPSSFPIKCSQVGL